MASIPFLHSSIKTIVVNWMLHSRFFSTNVSTFCAKTSSHIYSSPVNFYGKHSAWKKLRRIDTETERFVTKTIRIQICIALFIAPLWFREAILCWLEILSQYQLFGRSSIGSVTSFSCTCTVVNVIIVIGDLHIGQCKKGNKHKHSFLFSYKWVQLYVRFKDLRYTLVL